MYIYIYIYIYKVFTLIKVPMYKHYDRINDSWLLTPQHFPTCPLHKINEILEGRKYETAFSTVFRAACRWTDLKGSKHLDPWMLVITNKEPFTAEVRHYRSCYHTYAFWVGFVTSWVANLKHCMRQQKDNPTKNSWQTSETNSCQIHNYC